MKCIWIFFATCSLVLFNSLSIAQSYSFTNTTGSYTSLSSSTTLTGSLPWDDETYQIPIGFNFKFYNTYYDSVWVDTYGLLFFGNSESHYYIGFFADWMDRGTTTSLSKVHYKLNGFSPNRTLTIEFKNCGFYSDPTLNNYANFQMVLFEGSNRLETRMGPNSVIDPAICYDGEPGPLVGVFAEDNFSTYFYSVALSGNPGNPSLEWMPEDTAIFLQGTPSANRIYRFNYSSVFNSTEEVNQNEIKLYPNPSNGKIHLEFDNYSENRWLELYTVTGGLIQKHPVFSSVETVNFDISSGCYFIKIFDNDLKIMDEKLILID